MSWIGALFLIIACGGEGGSESPPQEASASGSAAASAPSRLSAPQREALEEVLGSYEALRSALAEDRLEPDSPEAVELTRGLQRLLAAGPRWEPELEARVVQAVGAAEALSAASDSEAARLPFGALSEGVLGLVAEDSSLQAEWHRFTCPMAEGFQDWVQPSETLENPYMGQRMLRCGSAKPWEAGEEPAHEHPVDPDAVAYWTCSMDPSVKQDGEGVCPLCGMDLIPVTEEELSSGAVLLDPVRRQQLGVRVAAAERRSLVLPLRSMGVVRWDETRLRDVSARVEGWVEQLYASRTGDQVSAGAPLLSYYSPDLLSSQEEYLRALEEGDELARAARKRLRLLGMTEGQIQAVAEAGQPSEQVLLLAPSSGVVLEKPVHAGAHIQAGQLLYRLADSSRVWVEGSISEQDMGRVSVGQELTLRFPEDPQRTRRAPITHLDPYLDPETRSLGLRVELDNSDGQLRPDEYVWLEVSVPLGEQLSIPSEAVIFTGPRRLVFVDQGEGRMVPVEIEVDPPAGGWTPVRSGLSEGDQVVVSGVFLLAAESRLRSATPLWEVPDGG